MNHLASMTDDELLAYSSQRMPYYRKALVRIQSFLNGLFGRNVFRATAGDYIVDVGGDDTGIKGKSKINLGNFKAPPFTKIRSHITALSESDTLDELDYIIDRLTQSENPKMKMEAKRMIPMQQAMLNTFNDALEALENIANKHLPAEVAEIFRDASSATESFIAAYTGENVKIEPMVLVGSQKDRIDFVQYIDVTEFVEDRLQLVITCTLELSGKDYIMSHYLTVQDRFQAPFNYDRGEKPNKMDVSIREAFAQLGFRAVADRITLKVDETRLRRALKALPFVTTVVVQPKEIVVSVKGNAQKREQEKEIFATLTADKDVRSHIGRTKRMHSEFTVDKKWHFSISAK